MLKKYIRIANAFIYSIISQFCDTCDSKKCKTPVYVRAWASKKSILAFITITLSVKMMIPQNYHLYSPHQRNHFSKTTSPKSSSLKSFSSKFPSHRSTSTDGSFSFNRRVTFSKRRVVFSQPTGYFPSFHRFLRMIYHKKKRCNTLMMLQKCDFFVKRVRSKQFIFSITDLWFCLVFLSQYSLYRSPISLLGHWMNNALNTSGYIWL